MALFWLASLVSDAVYSGILSVMPKTKAALVWQMAHKGVLLVEEAMYQCAS